uniref:Uncharacterized protein n=1 Tax=Aegilops tauschii subsp. strangulata TaxID=200361 RepID=A0A453DBD9_AEGTS
MFDIQFDNKVTLTNSFWPFAYRLREYSLLREVLLIKASSMPHEHSGLLSSCGGFLKRIVVHELFSNDKIFSIVICS